MSGFLPISVTLITKNEASRIGEAILSVKSFAKEIIVVDSGSTDGTAGIAEGLGAQVSPNNLGTNRYAKSNDPNTKFFLE